MPVLYLIPTPIFEGELSALPPATLEIARNLDFFIVERAKTARHFLKAIGVAKPLPEIEVIELDERDPEAFVEPLRRAIQAGRSVGVMSEAGCPGVADPGASVVAWAHRLDVPVKPLIGPSSILLALMASGMNGQRFVFHGYLSPKRPELARDLRRLEQGSERADQTQIFIETPYRSQMVLEVALETLLPDTFLGIAQNLTAPDEKVRAMPVKSWKQARVEALPKAPAVFLIYRKGRI